MRKTLALAFLLYALSTPVVHGGISESRVDGGVKGTAYEALYNTNIYRTTGSAAYRETARSRVALLLSLQERSGGWRALPGEPSSTYSLLESSMGTWALSEAYLAGVIEGPGAEEAILRAGDKMLKEANIITAAGYRVGLKPNALGYATVALVEAQRAAGRMDGRDAALRARRYRLKALEMADGLLDMQNPDGSWYDGPYHGPFWEWMSVSAWYQSMAWSGLAYASFIAGDDREDYLDGVERGVEWTERLRGDGGYHGVYYQNGTLSGDLLGGPMILQGIAIARSAGAKVEVPPIPEGQDLHLGLARSFSDVRVQE